MDNYSQINLQDAAFFSALAYSPVSLNAVLWGLTQSGVNFQSAQALSQSQWTDQTESLINEFVGGDSFYSGGGLSSFRLFVNSTTQQVVFAFKGSDTPASRLIARGARALGRIAARTPCERD